MQIHFIFIFIIIYNYYYFLHINCLLSNHSLPLVLFLSSNELGKKHELLDRTLAIV